MYFADILILLRSGWGQKEVDLCRRREPCSVHHFGAIMIGYGICEKDDCNKWFVDIEVKHRGVEPRLMILAVEVVRPRLARISHWHHSCTKLIGMSDWTRTGFHKCFWGHRPLNMKGDSQTLDGRGYIIDTTSLEKQTDEDLLQESISKEEWCQKEFSVCSSSLPVWLLQQAKAMARNQ